MKYPTHRCIECSLLRVSEDGHTCDECLERVMRPTAVASTIEQYRAELEKTYDALRSMWGMAKP